MPQSSRAATGDVESRFTAKIFTVKIFTVKSFTAKIFMANTMTPRPATCKRAPR